MRHWLTPVFVSAALVACGAQVTYTDFSCPVGYVCIPICNTNCVDGGVDATADAIIDRATDSPSSTDAGDPDAPPFPPLPPPPSVTAGTTLLDHDVIDAELSEGLWSVVTVSRSPTNALYIYDVGTKLERKVPLPTPPVAVSVDRSGLMAAVAYDGHVSWVDLTTGTVKVTCGLGSNAYDVALSTSGVAYVVPLTDQWVSLHAVDLKTCKESTGSTIRAASHIVLHPNEAYAFTADQGLSPSRVHRCALKPIDCVDAEGSNDWGTRAYCGNLWASTDGTRIYTACGATLSLPFPLNSALASYGGTLANEPYLQHLSDAPAADGGEKVVLVPQVGYGGDPSASNAVDTKVTIHDVPFLGLAGSRNLTSIGTDGGSTAAHGRFVFTTPTMSALFVVVQNGAPDAGVQFGIETLLP